MWTINRGRALFLQIPAWRMAEDWGDRAFVLARVREDGLVLRFASVELEADRQVVLAAVAQYGYALAYASVELKDDREVVLAAVGQNGYAPEYSVL